MFWNRKKSLAPARLRDYVIDKFQLIALYTPCSTLCVSDVNRTLVALTYYFTIISLQISQGCTNPRHSVALASKFSRTVPNICGPSVWNFLQVNLLAFRILRWVPDCLKISGPLQLSIHEQYLHLWSKFGTNMEWSLLRTRLKSFPCHSFC